ncbi:MAG: hypothetical protein RBT82_13570, partial [Desulfomonilia bacterium]|nr:hypothetical protein [Desulfomonilia bacterium]
RVGQTPLEHGWSDCGSKGTAFLSEGKAGFPYVDTGARYGSGDSIGAYQSIGSEWVAPEKITLFLSWKSSGHLRGRTDAI